MVLLGDWYFLSVLDGSGKFLPDLWIDFSSFALIEMLHDGYGKF